MNDSVPAATSGLQYAGSELALFAHATNWKRYWSAKLEPYLGRRVLDVGAGIGATASRFAGAGREYLALEPDKAQAEHIRRRVAAGDLPSSVQVQTGVLCDIPAGERFDSILYIDVLEHIEHDRDELEAAADLLAPGGRIIVLSPAHQSLFSPFDAAIGHFRRYDLRSLAAVRPPRLRTERLFYLDSVGLLASAANRLVLRAALPTPAQIALWDGRLVPLSRLLDPLTGYKLGKTVVAIFVSELN